jgi:hypothetical protein
MVMVQVMLTGRRLRRRSTSTAAAVAIWIAFASPSAYAQSTSDDLARRHFESAVAYLEESDYESAIKGFQKAYDLSQRPEILLNLATVHERKGDLVSAVGALRAYLEAAPEGEHVTTVKLRVQNLENRRQEQLPPAATPPAPAPAPTPAPAGSEPQPPAPAPAPAPKPESSRLPAFISLGVGGLMAGGALATGVVAKAKYDDAEATCGPTCRDDQLSSSRTFALTSTVLTGAAVLGVGLGVVLLLTTPDSDAEVGGAVPRWDVAVSPRAAAASAAWSF